MNYRFPLAIDPDEWARLKDAHALHPDEPVSHFAKPFDETESRAESHSPSRGHAHHRDEGVTLEEIGAELGLTRERVRQIEERAMDNFRIALRRMRLTEGDMLPVAPAETPVLLH